jgi:hypothetical protein
LTACSVGGIMLAAHANGGSERWEGACGHCHPCLASPGLAACCRCTTVAYPRQPPTGDEQNNGCAMRFMHCRKLLELCVASALKGAVHGARCTAGACTHPMCTSQVAREAPDLQLSTPSGHVRPLQLAELFDRARAVPRAAPLNIVQPGDPRPAPVFWLTPRMVRRSGRRPWCLAAPAAFQGRAHHAIWSAHLRDRADCMAIMYTHMQPWRSYNRQPSLPLLRRSTSPSYL